MKEHLPPWLRDVPLPQPPPSYSAGAFRPAAEQAPPDSSVSRSAQPDDSTDWWSSAAPERSDTDMDTPDWLTDAPSSSGTQPPVTDEPDWLTSLTEQSAAEPSSLRDEPGDATFTSDADIPDWLRPEPPADQPPADQPPADETEVPDWLRPEPSAAELPPASEPDDITAPSFAADTTSRGAGQQPPVTPGADRSDSDSRIQLPRGATDWLRSIGHEPDDEDDTPDKSAAENRQPADAGGDEDVPAWLRDVTPEQLDRDIAAAQAAASHSDTVPTEPGTPPGDIPSWLRGEGDEDTTDSTSSPAPAWLHSDEETPESDAAEVPSWLRDLAAPDADETAEAPPADQATQAASAGALPDWLTTDATTGETATESSIPDWLRDGDAPPADEPVGTEPPATGDADIPDWLREAEPAAPPPSAEPPATGDADVPDWLREAEPAAPPPSAEPPATDDADIPDWLREAEPAAGETPAAPMASGDADVPDWLREAEPATPRPPAEPATPDLPPWLATDQNDTSGAPPAGDAGLPAWLRGADQDQQAVPPQTTGAQPAGGADADMPPWLLGVGAADEDGPPARDRQSAEPADDEPESSFLGGADLPRWLRTPEPERAGDRAEGRSVDWLSSLGISDEDSDHVAVATSAPSIALPRPSYKRPAAMVDGAALLERLAAAPLPPAAPAPAPPAPTTWQNVGMDRILYVALLVILLVSWFIPGVAQSFLTPAITPAAAAELAEIDAVISNLTTDDVVLLAYEWDAQRSSELEPLETAVTSHLIEQQAKLVLASTNPQGTILSFRLIDTLLAAGYNVDESGRRFEGRDFVALGYLPGGELALRQLAQDFRAALRTDYLGRDATEGALATNFDRTPRVTDLTDLGLIVVMADQPQDVQSWMEQVHTQAPDVPLLFLLPAETAPLVRPYFGAANDNVFALTGQQDALEYAVARDGGTVGAQASQAAAQRNLAILAFISLAVVGGIAGMLIQKRS